MAKTEFVDVLTLEEYKQGSALKKVPLMGQGVLVTTLFIDSGGSALSRASEASSEVHYVVKGRGELTLNNSPTPVSEGTLILIPKNSRFRYESHGERIVVIAITALVDQKNNNKAEVVENGA